MVSEGFNIAGVIGIRFQLDLATGQPCQLYQTPRNFNFYDFWNLILEVSNVVELRASTPCQYWSFVKSLKLSTLSNSANLSLISELFETYEIMEV